jgi:Protein of unknown function (DUF2815)
MGKILLLKDVRCSFLVLGEPTDYQGNKKYRWSATALIPEGSPQIAVVNAAIQEVAATEWQAKASAYVANILTDPKACAWQPGTRKPDYEGYAGHWSLSAHRDKKRGAPLVMYGGRKPMYFRGDVKEAEALGFDPATLVVNEPYPGAAGKVYSGCFVNMQVEVWAQNNANGKGIRAGLMGVQFVRDGDSFGGGSAPDAAAFPDMAEGATADDMAG